MGINDFSLIRPDVAIWVVDALRPGHEVNFYPGETNLRQADIVVINKVGNAALESPGGISEHAITNNENASVIEAGLEILVEDPDAIMGGVYSSLKMDQL